jgi:hypothetical protein
MWLLGGLFGAFCFACGVLVCALASEPKGDARRQIERLKVDRDLLEIQLDNMTESLGIR